MLYVESANGQSVGYNVRRKNAAQIQEFAQHVAAKLAASWGTDVTVRYEPLAESQTAEPAPAITFNLGNLPQENQGS